MTFNILKVTKNPQGFTLSLKDTFFEKPQGRGQIETPPLPLLPPAVLELNIFRQEFSFTKVAGL